MLFIIGQSGAHGSDAADDGAAPSWRAIAASSPIRARQIRRTSSTGVTAWSFSEAGRERLLFCRSLRAATPLGGERKEVSAISARWEIGGVACSYRCKSLEVLALDERRRRPAPA